MKTSGTKVTLNKCYSASFCQSWLAFCVHWYWQKVDSNKNQRENRQLPIKMDLLVWLYDYCITKGYINLDFESFKRRILGHRYKGVQQPDEPRKHPKWRKPWYKPSRYQKGEGHGIKDPEALEKRKEWLNRTGKDKDHNKRSRHHHRGPKRFNKQLRSTLHRRWVKQQLYLGHYDIFWRGDRALFVDPWTYD